MPHLVLDPPAPVRDMRMPIKSPADLPAGVAVHANVQYAEPAACNLDVLVPPGLQGPAPIVVWLHPGGWHTGARWPIGVASRDLLEAGFIVATVDYRLAPQVQWPVPLEDCKAAIRFVREHARQWNGDPDRIGVFGHSSGGSMAAMMALDGLQPGPRDGTPPPATMRVQAAVDISGRANWLTPDLPQHCRATAGFLFPEAERQDAMRAASPFYHLRKACAPLLIVHGVRDSVVSLDEVRTFYAGLRDLDAAVRLQLFDAGHEVENFGEAAVPVAAFFKQALHQVARER